MPVGEGEVLVEVGEDRRVGVFIFHGKVWFRDCRPFYFWNGVDDGFVLFFP